MMEATTRSPLKSKPTRHQWQWKSVRRASDRHGPDGIHEAGFLQQVLDALIAFRNGDFSRRLPAECVGMHGKIADVFNEILAFSDRRANETARICRMVGKEGKLEQRMAVPGLPAAG